MSMQLFAILPTGCTNARTCLEVLAELLAQGVHFAFVGKPAYGVFSRIRNPLRRHPTALP
jgi:hypothetical protein